MLEQCELNGKDGHSPSPSPTDQPETHESQIQFLETIKPPPPHSPQLQDHNDQSGALEAITLIRAEYEAEINKLKKEVELATRTKESIVMRYANSEKEVLKQKKQVESAEKQIKNLQKETETLNKKNKMLASERERLINMIDAKVCDVQTLQKECDKFKEELSSKDFKLKWTQNKLSSEIEAHKETQQSLEKCREEWQQTLVELEKMKKDCQEMFASCSPDPVLNHTGTSPFLSTEDELSDTLDVQLQSNPFQKEIDLLKQKHRSLIEENNSLSYRVQSLQEERLEIDQKMSRLFESNADHLHQIASLQSDLAAAESLKLQLINEQERVMSLQSECEQLRKYNSELLADTTICRRKEAELLEYTQQVTEKNVLLQSEFSSVEAKSCLLEGENQRLMAKIEELKEQIKGYENVIVREKNILAQEKQVLETKLKAEQDLVLLVKKELDEAKGEISMMKKKYDTSIKEFAKELKFAMKTGKEPNISLDEMSQSSRTSSSTSLNNMDALPLPAKSKSADTLEHDVQGLPNQLLLIEKIVGLQKALARKQDKIEFLQENVKELVEALQKKGKIIQGYAMSQESGALSSDISDQNKVEMANRGHGIMASLYASKPADEGLTLELSLEISQKLQQLLEETLLKNITLKENLSKLGEEISRLTEINRNLNKRLEEKPD